MPGKPVTSEASSSDRLRSSLRRDEKSGYPNRPPLLGAGTRLSGRVIALGTFLAGLLSVGFYQLTSEFPFSFDPYWFLGTAGVIIDSGGIVFLTIPPPFAVVETIVSIGYVPLQSILLASASIFTGFDPVRIEQIHTMILAGVLTVLTFSVARRLVGSTIAGIAAGLLILTIPVIFQRWNLFVPENVGLAIFLTAILAIRSDGRSPYLLAILLLGSLAFHPRSFILYAPLLLLLWALRSEGGWGLRGLIQRMVSKRNRGAAIFLAIAALPFLIPLLRDIYLYLEAGATYTLAVATDVNVLSVEQLTLWLTPYVIGVGVLGALVGVLKWRSLTPESRFILIWWTASWALLLGTLLRDFPMHRILFYIAVPTALIAGLLAHHVSTAVMKYRPKAQPILAAVIVAALVAPAVIGILESPLRTPWVAWKSDERRAVEYLLLLTEGRDDFVVFTPEYTLPFAYGVRHVEMRLELISRILTEAENPQQLGVLLSAEYPTATDFHLIFTYISRDTLSKRFPVLKMFNPDDAGFSSSRVSVYTLENTGVPT